MRARGATSLMKLALSMLLLAACTAACGTSGPADPPAARPLADSRQSWTAISLNAVAGEDVRRTIADLLGLVDGNALWPEFNWSDHGVILVVDDRREGSIAYCVGTCDPEIALRGTSRVWSAAAPVWIAPGEFRFTPLSAWSQRGSGEIVAIGFDSREHSIVTAVHEDFHLHYQERYAIAFGEIIGAGGEMSPATRSSLEKGYSRSDSTAGQLRDECFALVDVLHAGAGDRPAAMAALRRFVTIREARRARPAMPSGEEDYWERQEGVPTNLERRAATRMKFADQSAIATALTGRGCETITSGSYFLVLGGLQAAVLDAFADEHVWPNRVYPRDGTRASSLFALVRAVSLEER